jgi:hypothetical protein
MKPSRNNNLSENTDTGTPQFKPLNQLKIELSDMGYSVRQWAAAAGLPWQRVYSKLNNERTLRMYEYRQLLVAFEQMKGEHNGTEGQAT